MIDDLDHQVQEALKRRPGRSSRTLLYVCILAAVVGISGYVWLNYESLASLVFSDRSASNTLIDSDKTGIARKDFEALKSETAESLRSLNEAISAQKIALKELADQVAALSAKVDASRSVAPPVISATTPAEVKQPAPVPSTPVRAARRRTQSPTTTGPISVGGAPLPPAPKDGQ